MTHEFTESTTVLEQHSTKKVTLKNQKRPLSALEWMTIKSVIKSTDYEALEKYSELERLFSRAAPKSSWPQKERTQMQWHEKNSAHISSGESGWDRAFELFRKMKKSLLCENHSYFSLVNNLVSQRWPVNLKSHLRLYLKAVTTLVPSIAFYVGEIEQELMS